MQQPFSVRLSIKEGPIVLRNHGAGISETFSVWDGITASEYFPSGTEQAFYQVAFEKPVTRPEDVPQTENELTSALLRIAETWSFSGGSDMIIEARNVIISPKFESNAAEVKKLLLNAQGRTEVSLATSVPLEFLATYSQPPLSLAVQIAQFARADYATMQLLKYFHEARINRGFINESGWFVNLYKVRDTISEIYKEKYKRDARKRLKSLGIVWKDWKRFSCILNKNDFRHAEISGVSPSVSRDDIDMCYDAARKWVILYLLSNNLSVV